MGKSARFQIYKKDGDYCEAEMWNCSRVLECMFQGSVFCLFSLYFFNCFSSTVVSVFLPPLPPTPAITTSHPQSYLPLALSMCPSYMFLDAPTHYPLLSLSLLLSSYCQIVLYFKVSGCILFACLFCWLDSIYSWDHTVFFSHCLAFFT